jgi:PAS domain S-box-containing protein
MMSSQTLLMVLIATLVFSGLLASTFGVALARLLADARRLLAGLEAQSSRKMSGDDSVAEQVASACPPADHNAFLEADAARERLQNVLDSTAEMYVTLDRDWHLTYLNKPGEVLVGRRSEEVIGRRFWDLFPEHIGNDLYQSLQRAMAKRAPVEVEWYNAVRDQSFIVHAYPTREGLALHYEDVTESKRAGELRVRLASIVESSEDAIISMDIDGTVQSWNAGAESLYGYTADEAIGCSLTMLAPGGDPHELTDLLGRLRDGARIEPVETVRRRKDGSTVQVFLTVSPVRDDTGRIIGASQIERDISAAAALAADNARLYREAEVANRAKTDFLAVMSHELRTPLNAIGGYAQLMSLGLRGPLTDQQTEDLARIRRSQLHLLSMVNDVLNFIRIEAGHAGVVISDVDVPDALSAAIEMVAPQIHAQGLTFEESHTPGVHALADREKLQQIVLNLLSNSIKYTQPGGHVQLCSRLVGGTVHIQVRDNGRGIPGEKLETIFEPFVRLDIGLTRTTGGTGLGLSISRDLARALGGELVAESELGLGSTFTLTIPASTDPHFAPRAHLHLQAGRAAALETPS